MKLLSKALSKTITVNNSRKHVKIFKRDYIIALRKHRNNGYNIKRLKKFNLINFGYVSLYVGNTKSVFWGVFK